jgi:hypothetical protein
MSNTISYEMFVNAWDKRCTRAFGLGYEDLPDIICMDDYWHDEMTRDECKDALNDMMCIMQEELGVKDFDDLLQD